LEGRIEMAEGPCARFEDGAAAAAATVESSGLRALHSGSRWHMDPERLPRIAHSARAAFLSLVVGSERVIVSGAVEVAVGSAEIDPDAPFEALGAAVRARVVGVAGAELVPKATGDGGVVHARPLFRSVRAGDRVWAAGVLVKHSEGERAGYREPARWALVGQGERPVVLAFDGVPRHHGAAAAALRGVRRVAWARAALALAVVVAVLGGVAFAAGRSSGGPPVAPLEASNRHGHARDRAELAADCVKLKEQHDAAVAKLGACAADTDCAVETRGGVYFGLEGCYRYRNRRVSTDEAAALEARWRDDGCAASYEICPPEPLAMCRAGRCVERPPPPLPETWHREEVPGGFFIYLPSEMKRVSEQGLDSPVSHHWGGGIELTSSFGNYGGPSGGADRDGEAMKIGGYGVLVWRSARAITVSFEEAKACEPPRCPYFAAGDKLSLHATCDTEEACETAWTALRSARFW